MNLVVSLTIFRDLLCGVNLVPRFSQPIARGQTAWNGFRDFQTTRVSRGLPPPTFLSSHRVGKTPFVVGCSRLLFFQRPQLFGIASPSYLPAGSLTEWGAGRLTSSGVRGFVDGKGPSPRQREIRSLSLPEWRATAWSIGK